MTLYKNILYFFTFLLFLPAFAGKSSPGTLNKQRNEEMPELNVRKQDTGIHHIIKQLYLVRDYRLLLPQIKSLLEHGASITQQDSDGKTPLEILLRSEQSLDPAHLEALLITLYNPCITIAGEKPYLWADRHKNKKTILCNDHYLDQEIMFGEEPIKVLRYPNCKTALRTLKILEKYH